MPALEDPGKQPHWELFPHGSDIGVRGYGSTRAEAFEQAALGLTAVVCDPDAVRALRRVEISCEAPDHELLLVDWLNALIYEMATRKLLFARFEVRIEHCALKAQALGEPVDRARHHPAVEPKGATYTELAVRRTPGGAWLAQCVVDV